MKKLALALLYAAILLVSSLVLAADSGIAVSFVPDVEPPVARDSSCTSLRTARVFPVIPAERGTTLP